MVVALLLLACSSGVDSLDDLPWSDASQWSDAPAGSLSWDWILETSDLPDPPPDVDYFGVEGLEADAAYVGGIPGVPWCYLSIGTAEDWRDDYQEFLDRDQDDRAAGNEGVVGEVYPQWPHERWLNARRYDVFFDLIEARLDICADRGFRLVELDNMDAFDAETGFALSQDDVLAYVRAIASAANQRGMGVIHKNATALAEALAPEFDAILLEDCTFEDTWCEEAAPYLNLGKPAFSAEYPETWFQAGESFDLWDVCERAEAEGVSTIVKKLDLNSETIVCGAVLAD